MGRVTLKQIREAVANYMASEGCGCCGDDDQHKIDRVKLAKVLRVKKAPDGTWYDFRPYRAKERQ